MIKAGGCELLMNENKNGDILIHHVYFGDSGRPSFNDRFALMIKECMLLNIGAEFGIGGLFNVAREEVQREIYAQWEEFSPALASAMESLQKHQHHVLHAAIIAKAPTHVICDIISRFQFTILEIDHLARYPIEVAFQTNLGWSEGLQLIVEATAREQLHPSIIYSAARHGLKWTYQMNKLLLAETNKDETINGNDSSTGLRLFMVAAMGDCHDLSSIYGIMKLSPEIL